MESTNLEQSLLSIGDKVSLTGLSNNQFNNLTGIITSKLVEERHQVHLDNGTVKNIKAVNLLVIQNTGGDPKQYQIGDQVVLKGLNKDEFNGMMGMISNNVVDQRHVVFMDDRTAKNIKVANIAKIQKRVVAHLPQITTKGVFDSII